MARLKVLLQFARLSDHRARIVKQSSSEITVEILFGLVAVYAYFLLLQAMVVGTMPSRLSAARWTVWILTTVWALLPLTVSSSIPVHRLLLYPFTRLERSIYWVVSILQRRRFAVLCVASMPVVFACLRLPRPMLASGKAVLAMVLAAGTSLCVSALLSNLQTREAFHWTRRPAAGRQRFPLWRKDFRYYSRTLDFYIALMVSIFAGFSEYFGRWLTPTKATIPFLLVAVLQIGTVLNPFSLDGRQQMDRYHLFPVRYRELLLQKHLALVILFATGILPLVASMLWKMSFIESCATGLQLNLVMASWLVTGLLLMHTHAAQEVRMTMGVLSSSAMSLQLALISYILTAIFPFGVALARTSGVWNLLIPAGILCLLATIYLLILRRKEWPDHLRSEF
jgi:hypothetical protein